jgi:hypothetical protein
MKIDGTNINRIGGRDSVQPVKPIKRVEEDPNSNKEQYEEPEDTVVLSEELQELLKRAQEGDEKGENM